MLLQRPGPPRTTSPAGTSFTDIKTGDWFYAPVCWAEELGVVSGYEDGGFHPSGLISRGGDVRGAEQLHAVHNWRHRAPG